MVKFCKKGDLEGVKAALQSGANVNTRDGRGVTGLIWAVRKNHNSVVELLLSSPNIDVNIVCSRGQSAVYGAVKHKNIEGLKLLLKVPNIDVNIKDENGKSALQQAMFFKVGFKLLLDMPTIDVNTVMNNGLCAVHAACLGANIEGLELLLAHPNLTARTLNQTDRQTNGHTPVMRTVFETSIRLLHPSGCSCSACYIRKAVADENASNVTLEHILALLAADPRVDFDATDKKGRSLEELALPTWQGVFLCCILLTFSASYSSASPMF